MTVTWRFVDLGPQDPFRATARMPILGGWVASTGRPLLLSSIWGQTHINVGWFDDIDATLDLDRCRELGIAVIRRPVFGGGTAYYEAGCAVMCSFLLPKDPGAGSGAGLPSDLDAALEWLQPIYLDALSRLGLSEVRFEGSSDLRWHGRKVGALIAQDAVTCHMVGGFLNIARPDVDRFLAVARIPDEKFKDKVVKDLREYICTAAEVAGRPITYEDHRDALLEACRAAGFELEVQPLTEEEEQQAGGFAEWIAGEDHLRRVSSERFRASAPEGTRVGFANHKGRKLCRAGVALDAEGVVRAAMLAGDMHVSPPDTMERVAAALVGAPAEDEVELRRRIAEVFEAPDVVQPDAHLGVTTDDLLTAVLAAIRAARP